MIREMRSILPCLAKALARAVPFLWAAPLVATAQAGVVIHEIHHTPDVKQEPVEFVELHNDGVAAVSLAGWELSGAVEFRFPANTVVAGGGFVVAEFPALASKSAGAARVGRGALLLGARRGFLSTRPRRKASSRACGYVVCI